MDRNTERKNKMKRISTLTITAMFVAVFAVCVPQAVMAAGTAANTSVTNTVVVNWNAGAVADSTTDTATFVVDRLVTFTVTNQTALALTVDVLPGVAGTVGVNVLAFDVVNASNTTLDFTITTDNTGSPVTSNLTRYWDDDGNGTYDGTETPMGAGLDDMPADTTWRVFVVADISSSATTITWVENIDLQAQALTAVGGTVIAASAGPWEAGTLQNVLLDATGMAAGDGTNDGLHSDRGYYQVTGPSLVVTKTADVLSDPLGNTSPNAFAVPGAVVRYVITIDNSAGTGSATGVTVVDSPPSDTTFVVDSISIGGVADSNSAVAPGDYNTTTPGSVTIPLGADLTAGTSTTVGFSVTID